MLFRSDFLTFNFIIFFQIRNFCIRIFFVFFRVIIKLQETVKQDFACTGFQVIITCFNVNCFVCNFSRCHLRRHEFFPNKLVKFVLVWCKILLDAFRCSFRIRRTNGFVGVLHVLFAFYINIRCWRIIFFTIVFCDKLFRHLVRVVGNTYTIGSHIGNQTDWCAVNFDTFIKLLGNLHCFRNTETEFRTCCTL